MVAAVALRDAHGPVPSARRLQAYVQRHADGGVALLAELDAFHDALIAHFGRREDSAEHWIRAIRDGLPL